MSEDDQVFTSTIMIDISEFKEKYINSKVVTFYTVNVYDNYSRKKWTISKRYSEFEALYKNLQKLVPNVPSIPGKTLFKLSQIDELIKRQKHLERFLAECVNRKDIMTTSFLKEFLELDRHSPNLSYNTPEKVHEVTELPLGIRDFYFFEDENIMFAACADMNIASRVDSYITNVNLPWEKKTDAHVTVGALFVFKINFQTSKLEEQFVRKWAKSFPEQTRVINFFIEKYILMVGLDTGKFILYKTDVESRFSNYEQLIEAKPHNERIMGIDVDSKKGVVYTCARDKVFAMTSILNPQNVVEINKGSVGYTGLMFDRENERVFLTNEVGQVSIYITYEEVPKCAKIVQTHSKNSIRGLDVQSKKFYAFTASHKGDISVLDLGTPGREKYVEELSYFGGDIPTRVIRYNEENSELITGDETGKIVIWSLKTGTSIFAWKAHDGPITQIFYDGGHKILITGSKDKKISFWKLPEKWINEEIEKFEKEEIKNLNDTMAMLRLQKALEKKDDDSDDSDDSLNGWDIRP